jgi:hypothetical protein
MRKLRAIILFVAFAASITAPVMADIIPPIGLAPGSEYQLIFATADTTTATSTDITTYNTFVTTQAGLNPSLPSATWTDIGSTATVAADVNAPNVMVDGSYLPVYNTQGILVSDEASGGLYSGVLDHIAPVEYDQYGSAASSDYHEGFVFTGTDVNGASMPTSHLGAANKVTVAYSIYATQIWMDGGLQLASASYGLYALSSPLVATPEPASLTLLGSALSLLAGYRLLKRRRA